jgi:hypothetical protein
MAADRLATVEEEHARVSQMARSMEAVIRQRYGISTCVRYELCTRQPYSSRTWAPGGGPPPPPPLHRLRPPPRAPCPRASARVEMRRGSWASLLGNLLRNQKNREQRTVLLRATRPPAPVPAGYISHRNRNMNTPRPRQAESSGTQHASTGRGRGNPGDCAMCYVLCAISIFLPKRPMRCLSHTHTHQTPAPVPGVAAVARSAPRTARCSHLAPPAARLRAARIGPWTIDIGSRMSDV